MSEQARPVQVTFPNGNSASLLMAPRGANPAGLVQSLGISAPPLVVLLFGGAESLDLATANRLRGTLSRSIIPTIASQRGLIIDGGTDSGVMAIIGELAAQQPEKPVLLGVAPRGKAKYPGGPDLSVVADAAALEPHHSHFVLSDTEEWGSEIDVMFALAETLAQICPITAVVAGGGKHTEAEVLRAARCGWPVIVLEESGGFSEQLTRLADPDVRRIAAQADLRTFPPEGTAATFEEMLGRQRDSRGLLLSAWGRFREYDGNARRLQKMFGRLQSWILICGVVGILFAITQKEMLLQRKKLLDRGLTAATLDKWNRGLHGAIILFPVLTAVLLGISHQFKPGDKWVLLRGSAEAVKREIFRYRCRAGCYSPEELKEMSAEELFSERLKTITQRLFQSEVSKSGHRPFPPTLPDPKKDDGLTRLTSEQYLKLRVDDQVDFYTDRIEPLGTRTVAFSAGSLVIGGFGTVLAAMHLELWIAVTTATASALMAYLKYYQTEETLVKYNQARADLIDVKAWWEKFSAAEKRSPRNRSQLVELTERVLEQETAGWSQRMIDALSELRRAEEKRDKEKGAAPKTSAAKPRKKPAARPPRKRK